MLRYRLHKNASRGAWFTTWLDLGYAALVATTGGLESWWNWAHLLIWSSLAIYDMPWIREDIGCGCGLCDGTGQ